MENDPDQVYVPVFTTMQFDELAETARSVYVPADYTKESEEARMRCVFPFLPGLTVTLDGPFMDDADKAAKTVTEALRDQSEQVRRNGEGLAMFMRRLAR